MTNDPGVQKIIDGLTESARVKESLREQAEQIHAVGQRLVETFRAGGRLYACGNGGSACDAMHLVEELVARYKRDRPGLPAQHLMDPSTLTCWSNDYEYETAFWRQVETFVRPGDVFVGISTSGNSANVTMAATAANGLGAWTLGLTGWDGGKLGQVCTELIAVPSRETARIQESHITIIHLFCEMLDDQLFQDAEETADA